jgi:hypothetical protein
MLGFTTWASGDRLDAGAVLGLRRSVSYTTGGVWDDNFYGDLLLKRLARQVPLSADEQTVGLSLRAVLYFHPDIPEQRQAHEICSAAEALERFVLNLDVGDTLVLNHLTMSLWHSCRLVEIGQPNRPLDEVLLWREGKSEPLTENYVIRPNERLKIESSIDNPIDLRPARFSIYR